MPLEGSSSPPVMVSKLKISALPRRSSGLCGDECPFIRSPRQEDWKIPDLRDLPMDEFRRVRDLIEGKVLPHSGRA